MSPSSLLTFCADSLDWVDLTWYFCLLLPVGNPWWGFWCWLTSNSTTGSLGCLLQGFLTGLLPPIFLPFCISWAMSSSNAPFSSSHWINVAHWPPAVVPHPLQTVTLFSLSQSWGIWDCLWFPHYQMLFYLPLRFGDSCFSGRLSANPPSPQVAYSVNSYS